MSQNIKEKQSQYIDHALELLKVGKIEEGIDYYVKYVGQCEIDKMREVMREEDDEVFKVPTALMMRLCKSAKKLDVIHDEGSPPTVEGRMLVRKEVLSSSLAILSLAYAFAKTTFEMDHDFFVNAKGE